MEVHGLARSLWQWFLLWTFLQRFLARSPFLPFSSLMLALPLIPIILLPWFCFLPFPLIFFIVSSFFSCLLSIAFPECVFLWIYSSFLIFSFPMISLTLTASAAQTSSCLAQYFHCAPNLHFQLCLASHLKYTAWLLSCTGWLSFALQMALHPTVCSGRLT